MIHVVSRPSKEDSGVLCVTGARSRDDVDSDVKDSSLLEFTIQ